ncbi:O-antigen ligase family protein [Bradyrhizobium sp.]|uniref:O-antigen ligase family protein n=1 Tax=Bradyrhizobium sp. TaxID=376 RepID=UPI0039E30B1A
MALPQLTGGREAPRRRDLLGKISAAIIYMALAGPPFLFGSRDATTIALWCALLGIGLICAPTKRLRRSHLILLAGIFFVVLCFAFVLHEQLSDHPWIAPFNPIWDKASEALGKPLVPSVSIIRGEPFFALGLPLANVLALTLGLIVGSDSDRARRGVRVMAWAGGGYALYGIFGLLLDPSHILWREKTAYIGSLTATFINRNTAAAYFGSCSVVWLVLLMAAVRGCLPRGRINWTRLPQDLVVHAGKDVLIRFLMLFVCLSAMFMTNSRGGVLISISVMTVTFVIYFGRDMPRGLGVLGVLTGGVLTALVLLQVLGGNVGRRFDLQGLSDEGRLSVYRSTLKIIADNPWFGTGLGTFGHAFPAYRSDNLSMQGLWDVAHNTHLEFAAELGIPLTIVVGIAWAVILVVVAAALRGRRRHIAVPLSAFAVLMIALVHSSIDFPLQVAGYSIVVFSLVGLGVSQAMLRTAPRIRRHVSRESSAARAKREVPGLH